VGVAVPLEVEALPAGLEEGVEACVVVVGGGLDLHVLLQIDGFLADFTPVGLQRCQFGKGAGGQIGVRGTLLNISMKTLNGAVNVEWSNSWRSTLWRTLPRRCMYSPQPKKSSTSARTIIFAIRANFTGGTPAATMGAGQTEPG
jgi:hypothetical protein